MKVKILHWAPRIVCILAILFISLFALDAFSHGDNWWEKVQAFIMHLIPSFILTIFLVIAWKWELVGGIIFSAMGIIFTPIIYTHNFKMNHSVAMSVGIIFSITVPFIVVGLLFIINYFVKRKHQNQHK